MEIALLEKWNYLWRELDYELVQQHNRQNFLYFSAISATQAKFQISYWIDVTVT